MIFRKAHLNQTAVYWDSPKSDGYGGRTFDDPAEVSVRWEDKQELFIDASGNEVRSQSMVYVDRDMDVDGYIALTTLDDLSSSDPMDVDIALPIRSFSKIPSIKGTTFVRKVWL